MVISLSNTLKGLHWDKIPGDNDDEVAARGILYLLIFQQLGQLVRWSWGYHILLASPEKYENHQIATAVEEGRYRDDPGTDRHIPSLEQHDNDEYLNRQNGDESNTAASSTSFESGGRTPVTDTSYVQTIGSENLEDVDNDDDENTQSKGLLTKPPPDRSNANLISFPHIRSPTPREEDNIPPGIRGWFVMAELQTKRAFFFISYNVRKISRGILHSFPKPVQRCLTCLIKSTARFLAGTWEFMNPPLWAMLIAVIVASIPRLQALFFEEGSFIANSVTRAVEQSGGVAVPLILVVLGANLARNTLPTEALAVDSEENQIGTKLLIASLISRMLLPTIIMAPMLALAAKYVPVSILDDPIFVIVCFLLTGAPSALQLAQICQINGVYEGVMSKLLFQSYVIWYGFPTFSKAFILTTDLGYYRQHSFWSCVP